MKRICKKIIAKQASFPNKALCILISALFIFTQTVTFIPNGFAAAQVSQEREKEYQTQQPEILLEDELQKVMQNTSILPANQTDSSFLDQSPLSQSVTEESSLKVVKESQDAKSTAAKICIGGCMGSCPKPKPKPPQEPPLPQEPAIFVGVPQLIEATDITLTIGLEARVPAGHEIRAQYSVPGIGANFVVLTADPCTSGNCSKLFFRGTFQGIAPNTEYPIQIQIFDQNKQIVRSLETVIFKSKEATLNSLTYYLETLVRKNFGAVRIPTGTFRPNLDFNNSGIVSSADQIMIRNLAGSSDSVFKQVLAKLTAEALNHLGSTIDAGANIDLMNAFDVTRDGKLEIEDVELMRKELYSLKGLEAPPVVAIDRLKVEEKETSVKVSVHVDSIVSGRKVYAMLQDPSTGQWTKHEMQIALGQNPSNPLDVDGNGTVNEADRQALISYMSAEEGAHTVVAGPPYYNTSGDGIVSPLDLLLITNFLLSGTTTAKSVFKIEIENLSRGTAYPYYISVSDEKENELLKSEILNLQTLAVIGNPIVSFLEGQASVAVDVKGMPPAGKVYAMLQDPSTGQWTKHEMQIALGQNPSNPLDVDGNGTVNEADRQALISYMSAEEGAHTVVAGPPYYNTSGDGIVSPLDLLLITNFLLSGTTTAKSVFRSKIDGLEDGMTYAYYISVSDSTDHEKVKSSTLHFDMPHYEPVIHPSVVERSTTVNYVASTGKIKILTSLNDMTSNGKVRMVLRDAQSQVIIETHDLVSEGSGKYGIALDLPHDSSYFYTFEAIDQYGRNLQIQDSEGPHHLNPDAYFPLPATGVNLLGGTRAVGTSASTIPFFLFSNHFPALNMEHIYGSTVKLFLIGPDNIEHVYSMPNTRQSSDGDGQEYEFSVLVSGLMPDTTYKWYAEMYHPDGHVIQATWVRPIKTTLPSTDIFVFPRSISTYYQFDTMDLEPSGSFVRVIVRDAEGTLVHGSGYDRLDRGMLYSGYVFGLSPDSDYTMEYHTLPYNVFGEVVWEEVSSIIKSTPFHTQPLEHLQVETTHVDVGNTSLSVSFYITGMREEFGDELVYPILGPRLLVYAMDGTLISGARWVDQVGDVYFHDPSEVGTVDVTGLVPGTQYYYVIALDNSGHITPVTEPVVFTTTGVAPDPHTPQEPEPEPFLGSFSKPVFHSPGNFSLETRGVPEHGSSVRLHVKDKQTGEIRITDLSTSDWLENEIKTYYGSMNNPRTYPFGAPASPKLYDQFEYWFTMTAYGEVLSTSEKYSISLERGRISV